MIKIDITEQGVGWKWHIDTGVLHLSGHALSKRDAARAAANMMFRLTTMGGE